MNYRGETLTHWHRGRRRRKFRGQVITNLPRTEKTKQK